MVIVNGITHYGILTYHNSELIRVIVHILAKPPLYQKSDFIKVVRNQKS